MASKSSSAALEVTLLDLSATLSASERNATTIARHLTLVERAAPRADTTEDRVARALAHNEELLAETRLLVQNLREGRDLLRRLQSELKKRL